MPPPYAWSITSIALDEAGVDLPPKLGERSDLVPLYAISESTDHTVLLVPDDDHGGRGKLSVSNESGSPRRLSWHQPGLQLVLTVSAILSALHQLGRLSWHQPGLQLVLRILAVLSALHQLGRLSWHQPGLRLVLRVLAVLSALHQPGRSSQHQLEIWSLETDVSA